MFPNILIGAPSKVGRWHRQVAKFTSNADATIFRPPIALPGQHIRRWRALWKTARKVCIMNYPFKIRTSPLASSLKYHKLFKCFSAVESYDTISFQWTSWMNIPTDRVFSSINVAYGTMIIAGGLPIAKASGFQKYFHHYNSEGN